MCALLLNELTNTSARHIPYRGNTQAVTDTVSGQVDFTCSSGVVMPMIRSGMLRALAVTGRTRWSDLPGVPTVEEAGVRGYELSTWIGIMAPKQTPSDIVNRLSREITSIAKTAEFREFCIAQALYVDFAGSEQFASEIPLEV